VDTRPIPDICDCGKEIEAYRETHRKSVLKAVTWRAVGTLDTFLIAWFLTGHAITAGSIASLELITKTALYYAHERAWARVR
jgi:uncharacterized membrane protein